MEQYCFMTMKKSIDFQLVGRREKVNFLKFISM